MSTVTSSRSSTLTQRGERSSIHNATSPAPESAATNPCALPGLSGRSTVLAVSGNWCRACSKVRRNHGSILRQVDSEGSPAT